MAIWYVQLVSSPQHFYVSSFLRFYISSFLPSHVFFVSTSSVSTFFRFFISMFLRFSSLRITSSFCIFSISSFVCALLLLLLIYLFIYLFVSLLCFLFSFICSFRVFPFISTTFRCISDATACNYRPRWVRNVL